MNRTRTILSSLAVVAGSAILSLASLASLASTGCSSPSGPPVVTVPTDVSFAKNVMPIFVASCTISGACHGQMNNSSEENLYLGDHTTNTPTTIMQTYMGLVGVASVEDPGMPLVTIGEPSKSYLSHKVVGDQDTLDSECAMTTPLCVLGCTTQKPCGVFMPWNGVQLAQSSVDTINNWITQGAKYN
jgi:hypothetical protein